MTDETTIVIPEMLPSYNSVFSRGHYRTRMALHKKWDLLVLIAVRTAGIAPVTEEVDIYTTVEYRQRTGKGHRKGRIDSDNVVDKLVIDGLRHAGILREDDPSAIHWAATRCRLGEADQTTVLLVGRKGMLCSPTSAPQKLD